MNRILLSSIGLLFLISSAHAFDETVCNHDNLNFQWEEVDVDEDLSALSSERVLAESDYPLMRFVAHYDLLDNAPRSFKAYVEDEVAPAVFDYLSHALHAKYPIRNLLQISNSRVCDVLRTPPALREGVEADIYVIFDSEVDDTSTVASSRYCLTSAATKRPIVTYSNINRNMFQIANGNVLLHEKNMYLLIHEMMHTLGVSKNSYASYIDDRGNTREGHLKTRVIGGYTQLVIDIPSLTQRLRNFYDCPTIPGLIMENDGSAGTQKSHVERRFFPYEVMASGGMYGRRVSEFILGLLEGSGWYIPDYSYAEPFFFGKGQGCGFINDKCSATRTFFPDEFCVGTSRGCAPQGRSGGRCVADFKTDGCRYMNPDVANDCENTDAEDDARLPSLEVYGREANSKCFTGTLNTRRSGSGSTSFCFKYKCIGEGVDVQLQVRIGNNQIICDREGQQTIDGYYGHVDCPDPKTFCDGPGRKYCPRGCMGRGTCINNICQCKEGYTGIDCGLLA